MEASTIIFQALFLSQMLKNTTSRCQKFRTENFFIWERCFWQMKDTSSPLQYKSVLKLKIYPKGTIPPGGYVHRHAGIYVSKGKQR